MKRVLYAEDSVASQALMRRYLKGVCEVVIAGSPREAGERLKVEPFSALITDYIFNDCDAGGLIAQARARQSVTELPIVVVSSSMDKVLATRVLAEGANEFAAKPLHPLEFRALIERMLADPYVCRQETRSASVPCLHWQTGETHHQFCPELGISVSAVSPDEADRAMLAALKQKISTGATPGQLRQHKLVTHRVEY